MSGILRVDGRKIRLRASSLIGSGGEAEIYDLGNDVALKRFKQPDHPDYALSPREQHAAAARLAEHQRKIPALMKLALPERVAAPVAEALDDRGAIAGYTMPLVRDADVLLRYGERPFRQMGGVTMTAIVELLADLHRTVAQLHARGVGIGDFNDLNVLVKGPAAHLIDIDSAQFGTFTSALYTARFLDPRLTDGKTLAPVKPHDTDSDWFAFAVIAFRLLFLVDPFGGIHKRIPQDARAIERISIFHPDVRVPKQALRFDTLPDAVLHRFAETFERDRRGEFPIALLTALQWTRCNCGIEHARTQCPVCTIAAPRVARPAQVVRGRITAQEIFTTTGIIVAAELHGDRLRWLEHRDGRFIRENGAIVQTGPLDPRLRFTLGRRYWIDNGTLFRDATLGPQAVGNILGGQTHFWAGPAFGFGFYRANAMTVAFVFDAEARGIRDDVKLPRIGGQLIDAGAVFTNERCWLFLATQENGQVRHRITVIRRDGTIEATHEGELVRMHGNAAAGKFLLAATDDGIVRVETNGRGGLTIAATFPDSEELVDASTRLFATADGLYAVHASRIDFLRM